jgi:ferredoxin-thioredoxin reductase catalytic subunit
MSSITTMFQLNLKHPNTTGIPVTMQKDRKKNSATRNDAADPVSQVPTDELIEKITAWAHRYAEKNGWVLNPDEKERETLLHGLASNRAQFGKQYCPCRLRSGDLEKDKTIICPCIYHRDEIAKDGHCHCRLFFRKDVTPALEVSK